VNGEELVTKFLLLRVQTLRTEISDQEVTDYLGQGYFERHEESQIYRCDRNGYKPARMGTAEGRAQLQVPRARESAAPDRSRLVDFLLGINIFRPFAIHKLYNSTKEISCMCERCMVIGCRHISLFNHQINVPNVPLNEEVDVYIAPVTKKHAV
jgi:hypothetical protein